MENPRVKMPFYLLGLLILAMNQVYGAGAASQGVWRTEGAPRAEPIADKARLKSLRNALAGRIDRGEGYRFRERHIRLLRERGALVLGFRTPDSDRETVRRRLAASVQGSAFGARFVEVRPGADGIQVIELLPKEGAGADAADAIDDVSALLASDPDLRFSRPIYVEPSTGRRLAPTGRIALRIARPRSILPAKSPPADSRGAPREDSVSQALLQQVEAACGIRITDFLGDDTYLLDLLDPKADPLAAANLAAAMPGVLWAEPDFAFPLEKHFIPDDGLFSFQQHLSNTGQNFGTAGADVSAPAAWDYTLGDSATTIAVLDNGVETAHPDLRIKPGGRNFYPAVPTGDPNPSSAVENHGTMVAGVAAARGNNALGVSGMAPHARVLPIKLTQGETWATNSRIARAIRYAVDTGGADVLNNSWGGGVPSSLINDAIVHASVNGRGGKGAPVIFSAGNSASDYQPQYHSLSEITPALAAGRYRLGFRYQKDANGIGGEDLASIDNFAIRRPDGYTVIERETFAGGLPEGWTASGNAGWTATTAMFYGGAGDAGSLRSGAIGNGQVSEILTPLRTWDPFETIQFMVKVSSEANGDFFWLRVYDSTGNLMGQLGGLSGIPSGHVDSLVFPATADSVLAVGASTELDFRSGYSQYRVSGTGKTVALVAPSNGAWTEVTTTDRTGTAGVSQVDYTFGFGGTSSAAPLVSGVAALLLSRRPDLTRAQLFDVLKASCDKVGGAAYVNGVHREYGHGRVNARKAMAALDRPPVLAPVGNKAGAEGQPLAFALSAGDPDGDASVFSGIGLPAGASITQSGFTWTPGFTQTGNYPVRIVATAHALADTESIVITIGNVDGPPDIAAIPDTAIDEGQGLTLQVTAVEPDGEVVSWSWSGGPAGSSFQGGAFAWTPGFSDSGSYLVRFFATSGALVDTEDVRITVRNVNRRPVLALPASQTVAEGQLLGFPVTASDPDGDPILIATLVLPGGAGFDGSRFLWLPGFDQAGAYSVRFYAISGDLVDSGDVAITVTDAGSGVGSLRLSSAPGTEFLGMPAADNPGNSLGRDTLTFTGPAGTYWFTARRAGYRAIRFAARVQTDTLIQVPVALKPHIPWLLAAADTLILDGAPLAGSDSGGLVVDLDYDGRQDIVVMGPSGPRFLRNLAPADGAAGPYAASAAIGFAPAAFADFHAFTADDLDHDGYFDFILSRKGGRIMRVGLVPPTFGDTLPVYGDTSLLVDRPGKACHPRVADQNGDGLKDLWLLCEEDGLWIYRNTGSDSAPAFAAPPLEVKAEDGGALTALSAPLWLDADGDGADDLLAYQNGRLKSFRARPGGAAALAMAPPKPVNVAGGRPDCPGCRQALRLAADGMPCLLSFLPGRPALVRRARLLGDLTGDGKVDAADRILLLGGWESRDTDPGWNPALNLALDPDLFERIDLRDLGAFGDSWGLEE